MKIKNLYVAISNEKRCRCSTSASVWSQYRDNIEEEMTATKVSSKPAGGKNPLDELFNKK